MPVRIGIVDYGCGNIQSLLNAFGLYDCELELVSDPEALNQFDKLVLPGVGAFQKAIQQLRSGEFVHALDEQKTKGTPIIGICLGMQLLCLRSDEVLGGKEVNSPQTPETISGLGWVDAEVNHLAKLRDQYQAMSDQASVAKFKVPHMGWNSIHLAKTSALFQGVESGADLYFVHSHAIKCQRDQDVLSTTEYGVPFVSAFAKENVFGVQFHPEKSHLTGLKIIENFVSL